MTEYAIISLGGKQYVVHEGERVLVDRLNREEGKTFQPDILFLGGGKNGGELSPKSSTVTAKVLGHVLGDKIRIGKYKAKSGYKRHNGFRASLTQIEISGIGGPSRASKSTATPTATPKAEAPKAAEPKAAEPKAAEPKAAEPKEAAPPKGLPRGYADLTVADVKEGTEHWNRPMLEAALAYEQENAQRKGAIAALESALAAKESS
jgi:large subunit ribosomal protein L21